MRKQPLVFIPGWNVRAEIFQNFAKYFTEYDLHYFTPPVAERHFPRRGDAYQQAVAALLRYIKDRRLARPVLLGWSMGGQLALLAASQTAVGAVALLNSAAVFSRDAAGKKSFADLCAQDFPRAVKHFHKLLAPGIAASILLQKYFINDRPSALAYLECLRRCDLSDMVGRSSFPLGILQARADKIIPFCAAEHLRRLRPDALLVEVPGAAHFPFPQCCVKITNLLAAAQMKVKL